MRIEHPSNQRLVFVTVHKAGLCFQWNVADEGVTWCRDTRDADLAALKVATALL